MKRKRKAQRREQPIESAQQAIIAAPTAQIVSVPSIEVAPPPTPEQVLKVAERQIQIRKGYLRLVAKELRPEDVLVFGGKDTEEVYLPAKPCRDILSWARVKLIPHWPIEEHHYTSPDGEFIEFVVAATIIDGSGHEVGVIGNRSTRDEFFGIAGKDYLCPDCEKPIEKRLINQSDKWKSWFCPEHKKVKPKIVVHYLPLHDVDIPSVRQASVTNLWNHALKAVGLCPTLSDLKEQGMDISKVKRIGFGSHRDEDEEPTAPTPQPAAAPTGVEAGGRKAQPSGKGSVGATAAPPQAMIPGEEKPLKGNIDFVYRLDKAGKMLETKKGNPFRKVVVGGVILYLFDNMELRISNGKTKQRLFDILDATKPGTPAEFIVRTVAVKDKVMPQIFNVLRIGDLEWEADGTPVLRRDAPTGREPGDDSSLFPGSYQAADEDIPF